MQRFLPNPTRGPLNLQTQQALVSLISRLPYLYDRASHSALQDSKTSYSVLFCAPSTRGNPCLHAVVSQSTSRLRRRLAHLALDFTMPASKLQNAPAEGAPKIKMYPTQVQPIRTAPAQKLVTAAP